LQPLEIRPVRNRKELDTFIKVPWRIYQRDPCWVPPLVLERKLQLSPSNPYFKHAEASFWVAYAGGTPVGRISAQIDQLFLERHHEATGFWGMLEAIDNKDVFEALFETAQGWLHKRGMKRLLGPFNLSINQECGLLVEGFDKPPVFMMGHNPPYYETRLKELGHEKAVDMYAYFIQGTDQTLEKIGKILGSRLGHFSTRPLNMANLEGELDSIFTIFNDAWSRNWGFVPFTRDEYLHLGKSMSKIASPELIRIASINGEDAGFIVLLPNLNEIIRDMDGRLLPFNWLKFLWRLKFHRFSTGRVPLMGVLRKYQDSLAGAAICLSLIRDVLTETLKTSIRDVELSWILEENIPMRRIIEGLGASRYKTYRIFESDIKGA